MVNCDGQLFCCSCLNSAPQTFFCCGCDECLAQQEILISSSWHHTWANESKLGSLTLAEVSMLHKLVNNEEAGIAAPHLMQLLVPTPPCN